MSNNKVEEKEIEEVEEGVSGGDSNDQNRKKKIIIILILVIVGLGASYLIFGGGDEKQVAKQDQSNVNFSEEVDNIELNKRLTDIPDIITPSANNTFNINDIRQPEPPKEIETNPMINLMMPEPPKIEIQKEPEKPTDKKEDKIVLPPVFGQIETQGAPINSIQQSSGNEAQNNPKLRKRNANVLLFGGGNVGGKEESEEEKKKNEIMDLISGNFKSKKTQASSFPKITDSYVGLKDRMILAGKMLDIVLETRISTAQDGSIRAIISSDVYSESGFNILIPAGSRVIGSYTNKKDKKSYVIEVALTRIVRPDGIDIMLGGMPITDKLGGSGIKPDKVYTGIGKSIMNSILMGAISLGSLFAAKQIDTTATQNNVTLVPNPLIPGQFIAVDNGNTDMSAPTKDAINNITSGLKSRFEDDKVDPVLIVNQGRKLSIMTNKDIVFSDENAFVFYPGEISALQKENCRTN